MTVACQTCDWAARRDRGEAPLWDSIVRTPGWDVVHATGTSLPGWIVLVARRHIESIGELTSDEAAELGPLIADVSRALERIVGVPKTYIAQFAEHPLHPHVHVHVIPRAADLPDTERGPRVFAAHLGVPAARDVPTARKNEIATQLRLALRQSTTASGETTEDR